MVAPIADHIMAKIYAQLFHLKYPVTKVATDNGVAERSVRRWRQNYELFGAPYAPGTRGMKHGRLTILTLADEDNMLEYLVHRPTAYLDEVALQIFDETGKEVSVATVSRALHRRGWSRKVAAKEAHQRSHIVRAAFFAKRVDWPIHQLVFVDESACCERTGSRRYGWAPTNQRVHDIEFLKRSERWSVLPALSMDGYLQEPLIIQGSVTAELFNEWMEDKVVPQCGRGTIFVMDNASIHRTPELHGIIERTGMRLEYLPPYSPDLNPIEQSFNVLKAWVRRHIDTMTQFEDFAAFIKHAVEEVGARSACEWFKESGWEVLS